MGKTKSTDGIIDKIKSAVHQTVVGQDDVIELLLVTVAANGHALIEGVPGLAKTLLINTLARTLDLSFNRVQFTPDLVPSDITGTEIIETAKGSDRNFRFIPGPVFSNIVLADEINRTPPKTQSALLQAMQEQKVTVLGSTYNLPNPFFVFATQNPIEYEGTYALPEAQLDRFLLHINMAYPDEAHEMQIIDSDPAGLDLVKPVVSKDELTDICASAKAVPVSDKVKGYAVSILRNTRPESTSLDIVKQYVRWGAGPRATQMLVRAAQAHAFIRSRKAVEKEDIDQMTVPVLSHRIILNYQSISDGMTVLKLIQAVQKHCGEVL